MVPRFVYDDDCGFCTWWAEFFAEHANLRLVGFSDIDGELLDRLPDEYEDCAHLVTDDELHSCGAAIEEALVISDVGRPARPIFDVFNESDAYADLRERTYREVADRRALWGQYLSSDGPE